MKNWYESSIKSLVEKFFDSRGYTVLFDPSDSWDVAMQKWHKEIPKNQHATFDKVAVQAREYAFDKKYGTYLYVTDYRSVCQNWNHIILSEIQKVIGKDLSNKNVVSVGANNGSELYIIFESFFNTMNFDVVEISQMACKIGKILYPKINFKCKSMDEVVLPKNKYDIFMSLRAAYCAGNNLDIIVEKAIHSVKPNGIIIFSISNGYLDISNGKFKPIKGIYNPENENCNETETQRNINWMKTAMMKNGCSNISLVDAESEILLITRR